MEDFNLISPVLDRAKVFSNHLFLLGKEGDFDTMYNDVNSWKGNAQRTMGQVLIYDKGTVSLDWLSVYKNTKGFYFKKGTNYYL